LVSFIWSYLPLFLLSYMDVGECGSSAVTSSKQQSLTDIAVLRLIRHLMQFS